MKKILAVNKQLKDLNRKQNLQDISNKIINEYRYYLRLKYFIVFLKILELKNNFLIFTIFFKNNFKKIFGKTLSHKK